MEYIKFLLSVILFYVTSLCCYSQLSNQEYGEYYYYDVWTASERHYNSWMLYGISSTDILPELNYSCEDSLVCGFISKTNYLYAHDNLSLTLLRVHEDVNDALIADSISKSIASVIESVKPIEYSFLLADSTKVYLCIYKIKGYFCHYDRFLWCSRNPPRSYYDKFQNNEMYFLYNLMSAKKVSMNRKEKKRILSFNAMDVKKK